MTVRTCCYLLIVALPACGAVAKNPTLLETLRAEVGPDSEDYVVELGDVLAIRVAGDVERQDELTVDRSGAITTEAVGSVRAVGRTVGELRQILTRAFLEKELNRVSVQITVLPRKYILQPGDGLDIRFYDLPELNVTLPVRPDGYITVPIAHEVRAAGRTVEELRQDLISRFEERELERPEVAVIVLSFAGHRVHVGGEVSTPGVVPLTVAMTVLEALAAAEGHLPEARLSEVLVIRKRRQGAYMVIPVNLEEVIDGTDPSQNIPLQPFDCVYVPESPVGMVNTWVDLYIRKNIPINFGLRPFVP